MPSANVSWFDYLNGNTETKPQALRLFPHIKHRRGPSKRLYARLLRERFRFLREVYASIDPDTLLALWQDPDLLDAERQRWPGLEFDAFASRSQAFPLALLREEPHELFYYQALRDRLRLRLQPGEKVYFLGPTAGGALEAIAEAGGEPVLVADDAEWVTLCEERMLDNRLPFDSMPLSEIALRPVCAKYVVLSKWLQNAELAIRNAYRIMGICGVLHFPPTNLAMLEEAQRANLRVLADSQRVVAGYLKHPGLPAQLEG